MENIKEKLELLSKALTCVFEYCVDEYNHEYLVVKHDIKTTSPMQVEELLYKTLVYTNYVASLDDEIEPKSFIDFITSKEYDTDFEILTNHIIDTLVSEEEE